MRRFWRTFSNNSRRKYQLLLLCLIILALNFMNSTLVFKSTHLKSPKHQNNGNSRYKNHQNPNNILNTEHTSVKTDTESKTVSYNEIIPDAILNEDINVVTEKNSIEKDYSNENYGTFPSAVVDNPWFSDHIHQDGDDPLGMNISLSDNAPNSIVGYIIQKRIVLSYYSDTFFQNRIFMK